MERKGHIMRKATLAVLLTALIFSVSCDRRSASELYTDAEALISEEKYEEAVKALTRIEKKYPDNEFAAKSVYRLAEINMNFLSDMDAAIDNYRHTADVYPDSPYGPKSRFMAGFLLANNTTRFDEAREQYELFMDAYPDNELSTAVSFELENLGKDINDIPQLQSLINADAEPVTE